MGLGRDLLAERFLRRVFDGIGSDEEAERKEGDFHHGDVETIITSLNRAEGIRRMEERKYRCECANQRQKKLLRDPL